jgi:hypothetical protein
MEAELPPVRIFQAIHKPKATNRPSLHIAAGLFLLALAQHACSTEDYGRSKWNYRVTASLDGQQLTCEGGALVSRRDDQCLEWQLHGLKCQGTKDADWLHEDGLRRAICQVKEQWILQGDLPGAAACFVRVMMSPIAKVVDQIIVDCDLRCRSGAFPCSGNASYLFSVIPGGDPTR